jgi:hypothetical protein
LCPYRLRFGADTDDVYRVSQMARNRVCVCTLSHSHIVQVVSVCNLLCLLRYIRDGLLHVGVHDMYCRVNSARFRLAAARYGYRLADDEERDEQYLRRLLAPPRHGIDWTQHD